MKFTNDEITRQDYNFLDGYDKEINDWKHQIEQLTNVAYGHSPLSMANLRTFDQSVLFGFTDRNMILTVIKEVEDCIGINDKFINGILNCRRYMFGTNSFEINLHTSYISRSSMKYLSNVNAYYLQEDAKTILKMGNREMYEGSDRTGLMKGIIYNGRRYCNEQLMKLLREASLYKSFVERFSSSRRLLQLHKLLQLVIESSSFCPQRGFKWVNNPILYVIKKLYSGFDDFPFREVDGQIIFNGSVSLLLPEITFALVELWYKYTLLDLTREELLVGINIILEWSQTSLDERMLDFKDARLNLSKILIEHVLKIVGIKHVGVGLGAVCSIEKPSEVWMNDDVTQAKDYLDYCSDFFENAPKTLVNYLTTLGIIKGQEFSHARVLSTLFDLKRLYIMVNVLCQHGLFVKNPVVLTMEKSILPRASIALTPTHGTYIQNKGVFTAKLPYQLNWKGEASFSQMYYEGMKIVNAYKDQYNKLDLEAEFIKALTNNSGGVDYVPTEQEAKTIPIEILKSFGKKRLMFFLFNPILFESYSAWITAMKSHTNSGERKQVDRRARIIQMVGNVAQLGPFLLFMWADLMGKNEFEFSSKKNSGTISDMRALLQSTGEIDTAQESADISGMDASTTRVATSFINSLMIEMLQKCDHERYFFASKDKWELFEDENGTLKLRETISVHPGIPVMQISEAISETLTYKLAIPELSAYGLKIVMDVSPHVFPSGKFSTNAQHSILNMIILRVFKGMLKTALVEKRIHAFKFFAKVSGDDIFASFSVPRGDADATRIFSKTLVNIFAQTGFKIGSLLSRFNGTFLQQAAIFGTVLPKPDRISLTTSERGEALKMGVFDSFNEFRDIVKELSGRVHFPSNTRGLLFLTANQLRRVRVNVTGLPPTTIEKIRKCSLEMYVQDLKFCIDRNLPEKTIQYRVLIGNDYIHFFLPLFSLFGHGTFDIPICATHFNHYTAASNVYTPRGSSGDWKIRRILRNSESRKYILNDDIRSILLDSGGMAPSSTEFLKRLRQNDDKVLLDIYRYIRSLYDHELAAFLGLNWLAHFHKFKIDDVLERMRLAKFPIEARKEWADRLTLRLNVDAVIRSRIACVKLENSGYPISHRLAFANTPKERITQAIISGGDTTLEFRTHRQALAFHMAEYSVTLTWMKSVEIEVLFTIDYKIGRDEVSIREDAIIDMFGGLMLSSGRDLDRDFILCKFGHNWYDLSTTFSGYYALTPGPYRDYKHEELVRFAARVYRERPDLLPVVWEAANIHTRYRRELLNIIRYGDLTEISEWKSIIHTRQCFELSTSIRNVHQIYAPFTTFDPRVDRLLNIIARDIAYSENETTLARPFLQVPLPVLIIHGSVRVKTSSLLSLCNVRQ